MGRSNAFTISYSYVPWQFSYIPQQQLYKLFKETTQEHDNTLSQRWAIQLAINYKYEIIRMSTICNQICQKGLIHTQFQDTLFIAICLLHQCTNSTCVQYCWRLNILLSLRLLSQACLMSMSAWVAFKWNGPIFSWEADRVRVTTWITTSQHDWLMSLAMDVADMWRWKWHQWKSFSCF